MLSNILQSIGLTDKEARVYLAALELSTNVVAEIAAKAKINRVTTYDIAEKLLKKGLLSTHTKAGIRYFTATDPDVVLQEHKRRIQDLQKALPELRRLHGKVPHPRIQYFEGIDGIKTIYADTLTAHTEILNYANSEEIRTHWPSYDHEYVAQRVKKKIYLRGIAPDDDYGRTVHAGDKNNFREIRLVPKEEIAITNEINIYDDKIAIVSFRDNLIGMIIENDDIANTQRALFKMIWTYAEKFKT